MICQLRSRCLTNYSLYRFDGFTLRVSWPLLNSGWWCWWWWWWWWEMMGDDGRSKSRRSEVLAMRLLAFHVTVAAFFVSVAARPARIRVFRGHGAWWLTAMIIPTKNPVRSWSPTANWQTAPETPRETASLQNHRCRITARWQRKRTTSSAACVRGKKERSSDTKTSVPRRAMVLPAPVEAIATSSRPTKAGLNFRWRFLVSNLSTYYR